MAMCAALPLRLRPSPPMVMVINSCCSLTTTLSNNNHPNVGRTCAATSKRCLVLNAIHKYTTPTSEGDNADAFKKQFQALDGYPEPLGATAKEGGVNFAIYSRHSSSATLCLISLDKNTITGQIHLDPVSNRTGDTWHILLKGNFEDILYGYKFDGSHSFEEGNYNDPSHIVVDPYAKGIIMRGEFDKIGPGGNRWPQMAGMVTFSSDKFDWEKDQKLELPLRELVIYQIHVSGITRHESSKANHPCTYHGVIEKLDHLKELGINCIELMQCHELGANCIKYYSYYDDSTNDFSLNSWGHSTVNFFSPVIRYSSRGVSHCGTHAINEFKLLVREAHKRGIEVLMDVVFNYTAEGNEKGFTLSFRGVDNSVFYMVAPKGQSYNYSGCGNTFNYNHPIIRQFIVDCLKYWVTEMHVDGFRFDLASILTRNLSLQDPAIVYGSGVIVNENEIRKPLSCPPLIEMISIDPVLKTVKLIAEAWDCGELYQLGTFPHWGIWSEWNGKHRDVVRQFMKGTDGYAASFALRLWGSPDMYRMGGRKPWNNINFVILNDGSTLADLVTYDENHNMANGEDINDGEKDNYSWKCGEEGDFVSIAVKNLRMRQLRNFVVCQMVSQGVPVFYTGDEYGHTKGGNNDTYCLDSCINSLLWDTKEEASSDFFRFCSLLIKFRREWESLRQNDLPTTETLKWHCHHAPHCPDWSPASRYVAFTLKDAAKGEIYVGFNTGHVSVIVYLPKRPGHMWEPLVDTSFLAPYDFLSDDLPDRDVAIKQVEAHLRADCYHAIKHSSIIMVLKPKEKDV